MDIGKLFELQKLDVNLAKVRRKLVQIKGALGESEELGGARKNAAATEADLHRWHAAQQDAELESQSLAQQIEAKDKELMSGRVSLPKELESLQANVESLRRQRSTVEDNGMEALLQVETLNQKLASAQASLQAIEETWNGGQSELLEADAKYKRMYRQIKQQREAVAQALPTADIEYYEELRARKAGIAVAPLQSGQCGVCHILVPTGVVSAVRSGRDEVIICPSCGRMLYAG